jgi:hypothetical protein
VIANVNPKSRLLILDIESAKRAINNWDSLCDCQNQLSEFDGPPLLIKGMEVLQNYTEGNSK